jgi:hypothetical protein
MYVRVMALNACTRQPRTFRVTGVVTKDGRVQLFDRNGNSIGLVDAADAAPACAVGLSRISWEQQIERMIKRFRRQIIKQPYASMSDWEKKTQVWMQTQRAPIRARSHSRYFSPTKRSTWEDAISCMRNQFTNANRKASLSSDPWSKWAETKSRNSNRRESERGIKESTAADDRRSGLQMRWHWSGAPA